MERQGRYIYCIVETKQERSFGAIGIGGKGEEVLTIGYNDVSVVVSDHPVGRLTGTRENMLCHQKVIEKVMNEFDSILPVRFGTIASDVNEIRNLLERRYKEFKKILSDMNHKVELGAKGVWKDMDAIFNEIVEENEAIRNSRDAFRNRSAPDMGTKLEVGRLVEEELHKKKQEQADQILRRLEKSCYDHKLNHTFGDQMFLNAAFLVDKGREKEFDNIMDDLSEEYEDRIRLMYAGPLPIFNFVDIVIHPKEWER